MPGFLAWRPSDVRDVFCDSLGARNTGEPEADELIVNPLGTPQWVLLVNPFDGVNDIFGKGGAALGF